MKEYVKPILISVSLILIVSIYFIILFYGDVLIRLATKGYPKLGDYYISFNTDDENVIIGNVFYKQKIYEETIDLHNLFLKVNAGTGYIISEEIIYDDTEIRKMLLEKGLAEIENKDLATKEEIILEKNAIENKVGIWKDSVSSSEVTSHSLINNFLNIIENNMFKIIKWILCSVIGVGTIITGIKKIVNRKKIDVIFFGEKNSGKTTLVKRLNKSHMTEAELSVESTSTKGQEVLKIDRVAHGKKDIIPILYDNPGDDIGQMVDAINKYKFSKSENKIVVIVISNPYNNDANKQLTNLEVCRAEMFAKAVKESKSLKKVKKVIVYINKCDLIYADEEQFLRNKVQIDLIYRRTYNYYNKLCLIADEVIFGSALKGWEVQGLKEAITKLGERKNV